ncbi:DUF305 domain-containing protein [Janibacter indicus]|uniref:DUF305 domain-containing protein n=1 Tax=Janibacter indicus TaxID=857417 RepID=A0A1L3MJA7_9MICO|nr:DUF305 domain-containing protein [Janibacter indicus]APH02264.1 hypothetical protein ASJ30_12585 [Janibacter indicus]QOK22205.1 DUF305 domain-containing protein [Janibacter indicus]
MIRRLSPFVLAAALTLGACSGDDAPTSTATSPDAPVLQPGTPGEPNSSLSGTSAVATPSASHNQADVDFLQDMIVHHAQAVVMGDIVKGRLTDKSVRGIASRISDEQKPEMKGMSTTLRSWGEKVPIEASNPGGSGHGAHADHAGMPGMATRAQLDELRRAKGADVDRLYLDLMVTHHEGALEMCKTLGKKGSDERTGELGDDIHVTQTKQIAQMKDMRRRL